MKTKSILWLIAITTGLLFTGCKKAVVGCTDPTALNYISNATESGTCTYQKGPYNADFENTGSWNFDKSANYESRAFIQTVSGSSFMPTHGLNYLYLGIPVITNAVEQYGQAYQDDVDFSKATTLTFDYEFTGATDSFATAEILFTANGTSTLWSKKFTYNIQKQNEVITLPALPDKGRLMFKISKLGVSNYVSDRECFYIDNIRAN